MTRARTRHRVRHRGPPQFVTAPGAAAIRLTLLTSPSMAPNTAGQSQSGSLSPMGSPEVWGHRDTDASLSLATVVERRFNDSSRIVGKSIIRE